MSLDQYEHIPRWTRDGSVHYDLVKKAEVPGSPSSGSGVGGAIAAAGAAAPLLATPAAPFIIGAVVGGVAVGLAIWAFSD